MLAPDAMLALDATLAPGARSGGALGADDGAVRNRLWPMLFLVALCQLADLVTFNFAVERHGPSGELGPLGLVFRIGGFWAVAAVKVGLIGIVMIVLARYPWQRISTRRRIALIVAGIGMFGAVTNILALGVLG